MPNTKAYSQLDYAGYPFHTVSIDIVGKLETVEYLGQEVSYFLTMVDAFSKNIEAIPVTKTAVQSSLPPLA